MARRKTDRPKPDMTVAQFLSAVPHKNTEMKLERMREGLLVSIPVRRPGWLVPPISWIMPFSNHRRVQLDGAGTAVVELCDGKRTVEQIVETFAQEHKLSFREAQLAVTQFLRELIGRGVVALVVA